jgi:hypothetical protein
MASPLKTSAMNRYDRDRVIAMANDLSKFKSLSLELKIIWNWPNLVYVKDDKLHVSTGGWSEHEKLLKRLEKTLFWQICWLSSQRGGHYVFDLSKIQNIR